MFRECVALALVLAALPGCSLILDFDKAAPADAAIDAPYTQAECEFGEPNDSIDAAFGATTGNAAICAPAAGAAEDRDFYLFAASGGTTTVMLTFTSRPGGDLDIKLYDSAGTMVASSREFGGTEMITCPGASPACPQLTAGNYVLEVFPGVVGSVNAYSFTITP